MSGHHVSAHICLVRVREHEVSLETVTYPPAHQLNQIIRDSFGLGVGGSKPPERMGPNALRVNVWEVQGNIAFELGQQCVIPERGPSGLTAA